MLIAAIALSASTAVWAHSDEPETSTAGVLEKMYDALGLDEGTEIDPLRVPPELLEELGEAVMNEIHPDAEVHEWMDEMMGGEGSESLSTAHRWMGFRYLSGGYALVGPMMGGGMMGRGAGDCGGAGEWSDRWGMMGNPDVPRDGFPYSSPEQIVKERYARGEISREEYRTMMQDLAGVESEEKSE